ncbi:MAG: TadE/TadG family type IV pilus assembly protein [Acidobacteriota bacterium]
MQPARHRRRANSRGATTIEFGLAGILMMAFLFLIIDVSWAIFVRATLQYAVREGCRYAITSQTRSDVKYKGNSLGHLDSIKYTVQRNALGTLGSTIGDAGWSKIDVQFYDPAKSLASPEPVPTDPGSPKINKGGNIVEVSVVGFRLAPLLPLMRDAQPLTFTARSSDRMEASPGGVAPNYSTGGGY